MSTRANDPNTTHPLYFKSSCCFAAAGPCACGRASGASVSGAVSPVVCLLQTAHDKRTATQQACVSGPSEMQPFARAAAAAPDLVSSRAVECRARVAGGLLLRCRWSRGRECRRWGVEARVIRGDRSAGGCIAPWTRSRCVPFLTQHVSFRVSHWPHREEQQRQEVELQSRQCLE